MMVHILDLSIDYYLTYIAHVGPGIATGYGHSRFLGRKLVLGYIGINYLLV